MARVPRLVQLFFSVARARQYLQHECLGYLAYMVDTRFEGKKSISEVLVVKEFPDVHLDELPDVPLVRLVEFRIDLIPGVAQIDKASYCLLPPHM